MAIIHKASNPELLLDLWLINSVLVNGEKCQKLPSSLPAEFGSGADFLIVEYDYIQYYMDSAPPIKLLAFYFIRDERVYFTVTSSIASLCEDIDKLCPSSVAIQKFIHTNELPLFLLGAPLMLKPIYIPKPWGQEIWYTGIEKRGVSLATDGNASIPLPWVLSVAPKRLVENKERGVNLLKILDPFSDPLYGDLYFELHEKKREVYVVTDVDENSWPDGSGGIRFGWNEEIKRSFSSEESFYAAYLQTVQDYQFSRRGIDKQLDVFRQKEGFTLDEVVPIDIKKQWMKLLPDSIQIEEERLRIKMNNFTSVLPLKIGDAVKIPLLVPHGLLHGVRVVEFQTPVYERLILSFNQKTLTQNHWDTEEALSVMSTTSNPIADTTVVNKNSDCLTEEIALFKDFKVLRLTLSAFSSCILLQEKNYRLALVIKGGVCCNDQSLRKECALLLPANLENICVKNNHKSTSIMLLASPVDL